MSDCFYCGKEFSDMYRMERNCNGCENNWAESCHPCYVEYKDSGSVGWDKHYSTHHYPVDIK